MHQHIQQNIDMYFKTSLAAPLIKDFSNYSHHCTHAVAHQYAN